jgi:hypothetical protein
MRRWHVVEMAFTRQEAGQLLLLWKADGFAVKMGFNKNGDCWYIYALKEVA